MVSYFLCPSIKPIDFKCASGLIFEFLQISSSEVTSLTNKHYQNY
jgi:hypothetical protein